MIQSPEYLSFLPPNSPSKWDHLKSAVNPGRFISSV